MKILLKSYSKLFNYQDKFGATLAFSPSLRVDAGFLDQQPAGNVECTAYTADNIVSGQTKIQYDHDWLFNQVILSGKASSLGADPVDTFSIATKGLKDKQGNVSDPINSYYQTDKGQYDYFTNVKSAIQMEYNQGRNRPQGVGSLWYSEFIQSPNAVLPMPTQKSTSHHEWMVCGWDEEHPDCFIVNWWFRQYNYMPRDVFNRLMDEIWGSKALTFAFTPEEEIEALKAIKVSLWDKIFDLVYNLIQHFKTQVSVIKDIPKIPQSMPEPTNVFPQKITQWANLIAKFEGANPTYNNPGNFKFAPLMATWGATQGPKGSDGGSFAQFPTREMGFTALCNFLILGCHDELKNYHMERTIKEFTEVYTNHPKPEFDYSDGIIKGLQCTPDTLISTFIE